MNHLQNKVIGALIGLARATDGNEHLITPDATAVVIQSLAAVQDDRADLENMLRRIDEEKRRMVPNCFLCANPCGRTSDYDLAGLEEAEAGIRDMKKQILAGICRAAAAGPDHADHSIFYSALIVIGMDDYTEEDLLPILREVDSMTAE